MPYSEDEKRNIILNNGLDPEKYYFNESTSSFFPKTGPLAQPSAPRNPSNDTIGSPTTPTAENFSTAGTIARHAAASAFPAAGGLAAGVGLPAAALVLAPETAGLSLVALGLAGAFGGSYLANKAQQPLLSDKFKQDLAQSAQQHPIAAEVGGIAPNLLAFNPVKGLTELPTLARGISKIPTALRAGGLAKTLLPSELNAVSNAAINTGAAIGQEIYNQAQSPEPFDLKSAAMHILPSLLLNEPTTIGKRLGFHSTQDIRNVEQARRQTLADNQGMPEVTNPLSGRYDPNVGTGDVAPYDVTKSQTRRDAESGFKQDSLQKQKEFELAREEERNTQLKEALRIRDENEKLKAELGNEGTPVSSNTLRITKPAIERGIAENQVKDIQVAPTEADNTLRLRQGNLETDNVPLTEAELIQEHADKYPEQYSQQPERPLLLSDLTPQQREHLNAHQEELASRRGFAVERPNQILDTQGKPVAGVNPNTPRRTVQVSETKGGPGTVPHETGGHGFVNDLLKSSDPKDVKLAQKALDLFKNAPEGPHEALAKAFEKAAFYRDYGDLYGTKLQKFKSWFGDVKSAFKTKLGVGNERDVVQHLNARYNYDSPYYSRFELPLEARDLAQEKDKLKIRPTQQPQYSNASFQPEDIHKMSSNQFYDATKQMEGGLTREAVRVGLQAKDNPERQAVLSQGRDKAQIDFRKAMDEKRFDEAGLLASKAQYFREALEAAKGEGGIGEMLAKGGLDKQFSGWSDLKPEDLKYLKEYTGFKDEDLKRVLEKKGKTPEDTKARREMTMLSIMDEKGLLTKDDTGHKKLYTEATMQAMNELERISPSEKEHQQFSKESQINSDEFKKWFSGSKLKNEEGKPIEFYHGTNADVKSFKQAKEGSVGKGIYFTPNSDVASSYSRESANAEKRTSGSNVIPVYLNLKNPLEVSLKENPNPATSVLQKLGFTKEKANAIAEKALEEKGNITGEIQTKAINQGYDGIIVRKINGDIHEVVAFKPEQIKSSIGNKGTFDPNNPNIEYSKESNISLPGFRDEIEKINRLENPEAPKVAKALTNMINAYDKNIGVYKNTVIRELKDDLGIRATKSLVSYTKQNNEAADRLLQYRDDVNDYGASSIKLTPEEKIANKSLTKSLETVGLARNARKGLHQGELRPEEYFMNTPSSKVINILSNERTSPEGQKLVSDFIKFQEVNNKDVAEAKDPRAAALNNLETFLAGYNKQGGASLAEQFGPLDKSAGIGIPQSWREPNLLERVGRYMDRVARRLAYYDNVESKPEIQKALSDPETGLGLADPVKNVLNRMSGVRPAAEVKRDSSGRLIRSLMMGTLTGVKDMVSNPFLGWQHQTPRQALMTGVKRWQNLKENLAESFLAGVNRENIGSLEFGDDVIPWVRKLSDITSDVTGRNFLEKLNRATAFGEGKWLVMDNFANFKKGDISTQGKKFLKDFGPEGWEAKKSLTPEEISDAAALYAKSVQGHYNQIGLPQVAVEGSLAPVLSLARWNIEKTNNFFKHVVTPAIRDKNYTPLLMSTLGMVIGGEAVNQIAQMISGKKEKTPTLSEVANTDEGQMKALGYKMAGLASLSGYAGMLGDISKAVGDMAFKNKPQGYNNLLVETAGNLVENTHNLVEALQEGDLHLGIDFISKMLEDNVQSYRLILNHPDLYKSIAPQSAEERRQLLDRQEKFRDFKMFRNLHDYPVSDANQTIPNVFADKEAKEFKRTPDIGRALELQPDLVSRAIEKANGDPEKIKKNLEALKGNSYQTMPKPDNSPLEFQKYMKYVRETQGDNAALSLLVDYVRQNALNQAKSGLIP